MMLKKATARSIFWLLALAAAAVALALLVGRNHAMVTVFWAPYRLDLSFNLLLFLTVVVFVLMHLTLRGHTACVTRKSLAMARSTNRTNDCQRPA